MDILKYLSYFHDGNLFDIKHIGNKIDFLLESSQIESNAMIGKGILSKSNTLKGKLHVINIKNIKLGNKQYNGILQKKYDDGEILDLKIQNTKMLLLVEWNNFPPKPRTSDVSKIEIEAEKIYWENIPNLETIITQ